MDIIKLSVPDLDISIPPTPDTILLKEEKTEEGDEEVRVQWSKLLSNIHTMYFAMIQTCTCTFLVHVHTCSFTVTCIQYVSTCILHV